MRLLRSRFLVMGVAALMAVGCGKTETGAGAGSASAPSPNEITFTTSDGWTIHADYAPVSGAMKAVLLLHQRNGSAADWKPLVSKLNAAGIATLALDQRGAGRSQGRANGSDAPWETSNDVVGAVGWLKQKGFAESHIGLAGASYGANNALLYAASHPAAPAAALLSPGADYHGLKIEQAAKSYQGSILVLTASGDSITGGGPERIARVAPASQQKTYDGDAHGTGLFDAHADSLDALVAFFKEKL